MRFIFFILVICLSANLSFAQTHITQIKPGEKMPEDISLGGYEEKSTTDCRCRLFQIRNEEIAIYFSQQDTVTAVQKVKPLENFQEALNSYVQDMTHYMKIFGYTSHKNLELLEVRNTNENLQRDAKYYFTYRDKESNVYTSIGIFGVLRIEERYLKDSEFEPSLVN